MGYTQNVHVSPLLWHILCTSSVAEMLLDTLTSRNKFSLCLLASLVGCFVVTYECFSFYSFRVSSLRGTLFSLLKDQVNLPIINGVTDFTGAANATLGFEAILVVSPNKSLGGETVWRQEGMNRAANLTGLTIRIPAQPNFPLSFNYTPWLTPVLRAKIQADTGDDGKLHNGQLMSRLGHLNVLHGMLEANISSAIVMENDGDWGVEIKSQTPAIASAIRSFTNANLNDSYAHPWGTNYDLLALGHCGAGRASPFLVINDSTVLEPELYSKLRDPEHEVPEHGRMIYKTSGAVCTYAYAVTRSGAEKLIAALEDRDGPWDILVGDQCRDNRNLWCGAVTPEIFHHQRWTGHAVLTGDAVHGALHPGERSQKFTHNIRHSARCNSEPDVDLSNGLVECLPMNWTREYYPT